jgi:hypothetical protein
MGYFELLINPPIEPLRFSVETSHESTILMGGSIGRRRDLTEFQLGLLSVRSVKAGSDRGARGDTND